MEPARRPSGHRAQSRSDEKVKAAEQSYTGDGLKLADSAAVSCPGCSTPGLAVLRGFREPTCRVPAAPGTPMAPSAVQRAEAQLLSASRDLPACVKWTAYRLHKDCIVVPDVAMPTDRTAF